MTDSLPFNERKSAIINLEGHRKMEISKPSYKDKQKALLLSVKIEITWTGDRG